MNNEPKWLEWAKKLQALAQSGLAYSDNKYDIERFEEIRNISIDMINQYTDINHKKVRDLFASERGYQTPKVDVRAAIFKDNKILLIKEQIDGLWAMPGGWADIDTSLREALIKESKEEAGADVEPKRVIAILDRRKHNPYPFPFGLYKIFVECDYLGGEFQSNIETLEAKFFKLEDLPPLSLGRNTKEQIAMCFEARKKNCHETIFD
ncbi:NUDIX hydrolase N-terminal domain-containing protein [Sporosalibacterium faouarense]|uniref:NUDIX hydrolase N-terminal domain-containing protein n=1 Tax=Sporosalibacterium faouarense TaxID=516123 RepID=UPI00141C92C6|nr:NUDIX hydrolase [Sporosalibacterium faouarense]MTI49855.1 NUDIX hydrolase [Bacillota bacterium]